jgi:hypothetical protein
MHHDIKTYGGAEFRLCSRIGTGRKMEENDENYELFRGCDAMQPRR